jgi:hypothetical protein
MLTQLNDNGWEFVVAYANWSTTKQKPNIVHMKMNASLFGQFLLSSAIYMVAHLFWLPITSL